MSAAEQSPSCLVAGQERQGLPQLPAQSQRCPTSAMTLASTAIEVAFLQVLNKRFESILVAFQG